MRINIILFCCLLSLGAFAQSDTLRASPKYYNSFVSGVLIGSKSSDVQEVSMSFTTIHGIKLKSGIKLGLGVGFDTYYDLKVIPFIASLTIDQERKPHALFVQLNTGYSVVRHAEIEEEIGDRFGKGPTLSAMMGYRMIIGNYRIFWQAGYKYQEAEVGYTYEDWSGSPQRFSREYDLNRLVIQLGFGFQ